MGLIRPVFFLSLICRWEIYIAHFAFIQILYAAILSIFQDRLRVFVEDNSTSKCNKKCDKSMSIERGTSLKILERKKISQLIPFTSYTQFVGETQGMPVAVIIRCLSYVSGNICILYQHYSEIIMTPTTSQITSLIIVYLTVYLGADKKKKHQSSASLAFVWGISQHKWPEMRKTFPFDDTIMMITGKHLAT